MSDSEFDARLRHAVKAWVQNEHNFIETRITQRIHELEQIERAWFSASEGLVWSEYTAESPSVEIEYTYRDMGGARQTRGIDIDSRDVAEFLGELLARLEP